MALRIEVHTDVHGMDFEAAFTCVTHTSLSFMLANCNTLSKVTIRKRMVVH